jgi:GrpB-like predicted nucleotidyltransferase (UPF0157 family)
MLIEAYNEDWSRGFHELKTVIAGILVQPDVTIEHIGSTAVPGLAAKPIIDIDIVYYKPAHFEAIKQRLEKNGYYHNGNQGIPGREVFKRLNMAQGHDILDIIPHHLYVCPAGGAELERHILFRNYLMAHEEARTEYQQLKYTIAEQAGQDRKQYARLKEMQAAAFINKIIQMAAAEQKTG